MSIFEYPLTRRIVVDPLGAAAGVAVFEPQLHVAVSRITADGEAQSRETWIKCYVDTGSDWTYLERRVARTINASVWSAERCNSLASAAGPVDVQWSNLRIRVGLPVERKSFVWDTVVGIVPDGALSHTACDGVFGIRRGLDEFLRVEFQFHPVGLEMPLIRITTP